MTFVSPICVFGTGLSVAWDDILHESGNIVFSNKAFYDSLDTAKFFDPLNGSVAVIDAQKMLMVEEGIKAGLTPDQIAELTPLDAPTLLAQNFKNRLHSIEHQVTLKIASSLPKDLFEDEQTEYGASLLAHKGITAAKIAQSSIHFVGVLGKATGALMVEKRVMDASSLVDLFGVLSGKGFFSGASNQEIQDVLASFIPFYGNIEDFKAIPVNSTPNVAISKCVDYIKLALEVNKQPAIYQKLDGTSTLMDSNDDKSDLLLALLDYPRITPKYVRARAVDPVLLQNNDIESRKFSLDMALLDSGEKTALETWFTASDPANKNMFLAANQTGVLTGLDKAQDIIDISTLYQPSSTWADANLNKLPRPEDKRKALTWASKDITIGAATSKANEAVFGTAMTLGLLDGLNKWDDMKIVLDRVAHFTLGGETATDTYDENFTRWSNFDTAFTFSPSENRALLAFLSNSDTATGAFDLAVSRSLFSGIESNWVEIEKVLKACQVFKNGPDAERELIIVLSNRDFALWAAQNHPLNTRMFNTVINCGLIENTPPNKIITAIMNMDGLPDFTNSNWANEVHNLHGTTFTNTDMMNALNNVGLFTPFAGSISPDPVPLTLEDKKQLTVQFLDKKITPRQIQSLKIDPRIIASNVDILGRCASVMLAILNDMKTAMNFFLNTLPATGKIDSSINGPKPIQAALAGAVKAATKEAAAPFQAAPVVLFDQIPYPPEMVQLLDPTSLSKQLIEQGFSSYDIKIYGPIITDVIQALQPSDKDFSNIMVQSIKMAQALTQKKLLGKDQYGKQNSFLILELMKRKFDTEQFIFVPDFFGGALQNSPQGLLKYIELGARMGSNPVIYQKFNGDMDLFAENSWERFDILNTMAMSPLFDIQSDKFLDTSLFLNDTNADERVLSIYIGFMPQQDREVLLTWFEDDANNKNHFMDVAKTGLISDIDQIKEIIMQYSSLRAINFRFLTFPQDRRALLSFLVTPVNVWEGNKDGGTWPLYAGAFDAANRMRIFDGLTAWGNGADDGLLATCFDLMHIAGVTQGTPPVFNMTPEFTVKAQKIAGIIEMLSLPQDKRAALHFFAQDGNMLVWDKLVELQLINMKSLKDWKAVSGILMSYLSLTKWSNFDEALSKFIPQANWGEFIIWAGTPGATHLFDVARSSALLNGLTNYQDIKTILDKLQNLSGFMALDIGAFDVFGSSSQAQKNALDWAQIKENRDIFDAAKQEGLINDKGTANGADIFILLSAYKTLSDNNDMNLLKGLITPLQKSDTVIWYNNKVNADIFRMLNHGNLPVFNNLDLAIDAKTGKNAMQKIVDALILRKIDPKSLDASAAFLIPEIVESAQQRLNRLLIPMIARSMPALFDNLAVPADAKLSGSDEVIINLINMDLNYQDFVLAPADIASLNSVPETPASRTSKIVGFIIFNSNTILFDNLQNTTNPKKDLMNEINKLGIDLRYIGFALPLLSPSTPETAVLRAARIGRAIVVATGLGNAITGGTLVDLMTGLKDVSFADLKAASMLVNTAIPQTVTARIGSVVAAKDAITAAGADAGLVVMLGASPEARLALLTGYKTDANKALLKPAFDAGIFKDFQAATWAQVSSILVAYKGAGADAANLISLAQNAPAKVLLLTGYAGFTNKARFANAFNVDKIFEGIEAQEDFARIGKLLDNYDSILKLAPQTGLIRLFSGMQSGFDKRLALEWFSPAKAPFFAIENLFLNIQDLSVLDAGGQNGYQRIVDACLGGMSPQVVPLVDTAPESSNDRAARIKLAIALDKAKLSLNSKDVVNGLLGINPDMISTAATFIGTPVATDTPQVRIGKIQSAAFIASSDALKNVSGATPGATLMAELMGLGLSADMMIAGMPSVDTSIPEDAKARARRIAIAAVLDQDISSPELVNGLIKENIRLDQIALVMQLIDLSPGQKVDELLKNITFVASKLSNAGKNALKIMSFASNSIDKMTLLDNYKTATTGDANYEKTFDAAFDAGLFEGLNSLTTLTDVTTLVTSCKGVLIDGGNPWANLYQMLKSLTSVQDKKNALDYFKNKPNDAKNYDLALASGLLAELSTWGLSDSVTLAGFANMYAPSKAAIDASLTKFATPADKRNFVIAYQPIAKWATTPSLLAKFANADDLKSLAAYFGDISVGAKRQKAYDKVSLGFGNTSWQNIMPLLNQYLPVDELLSADDATKLFAGNVGVPALTWVSSPAPAAMLNALNTAKLLDLLSDGTTVTASFNGYQTLVNSLKTAAIPLANIPVLGSALVAVSQTASNRSLLITSLNSKYAVIASWANVSAALAKVASAADKNALILYFSDATLGNSRRNTYDAIATYDDNAANITKVMPSNPTFAQIQTNVDLYLPILTKVSSSDKTLALKYFTDATSGAARKTAYSNIATYDNTNVSSKIISSDLTTWSAIQDPINQYLLTSPTSAELSVLFGGMSVSADKRAALSWFGAASGANAAMMRAIMKTTLASGVNDLTTIASSQNGYQRLVAALGATPASSITTTLNTLVDTTAENAVTRAKRIAATITLNSSLAALSKNTNPAATVKMLATPFMGISVVNSGATVTLLTPALLTADVLTAIGGAAPATESAANRANRIAFAIDIALNPNLYKNMTTTATTNGAKAKELVDALITAGVAPSKITPALITSVGANPAAGNAAARAALINSK